MGGGEPNETTAEKAGASSNISLYAAIHRTIKYWTSVKEKGIIETTLKFKIIRLMYKLNTFFTHRSSFRIVRMENEQHIFTNEK